MCADHYFVYKYMNVMFTTKQNELCALYPVFTPANGAGKTGRGFPKQVPTRTLTGNFHIQHPILADMRRFGKRFLSALPFQYK